MSAPAGRVHNIPMLLRTAEALEKGLPNLRFDMNEIEARPKDGTCGSISCIIGHVLALRDGQFEAKDWEGFREEWSDHVASLKDEAGEALGLSPEEQEELFFPDSREADHKNPFNAEGGEFSLRDVTPQGAAAVVRGLAHTGEIDWWLAFSPSAKGESQ